MTAKNIILLHGWGSNVKKMNPLARELHKRGWSVFIPKLPGFDAPVPGFSWSVSDYTDFVKKKSVEKYGNDFFLFGHSFGGRVTIKLASKENSNFKGIILCSAAGLSRGSLIKRYIFWTLAKIGKILSFFPQMGNLWKKLLYKLAREHDYEKTNNVMREIFKKVVSEDLKSDVKKINLPTLILWGELDKATPVADAFYIKRNVKKSMMKIYKNIGHRLPYEKYAEVAEEIDRWYTNLK